MDSTVLDVCDPTKADMWEKQKTPDLFQLHHLSSCTKKIHILIVFIRKKRWCSITTLHPWRITWTIIMVICRFHVDLPGCTLQEVLNAFAIVQFFLRVQQISYHFVSDKTPIYLPCGFLSKPPTIKKLQMFIKFFSSWPQQLSWISRLL